MDEQNKPVMPECENLGHEDNAALGGNKSHDENLGENNETRQGPPAIPEELRTEINTEKKWADTFGIEYDERKVIEENGQPAADSAPVADPAPGVKSSPAGGPAPMYVMPPDEQLPPVQPEFREPMPPTYMVWAVISTVCCCLPLGVVAIFFAAQVSTKYYARDFEGAKKASERAELWIILAIALGVAFNILYMPLSLLSSSLLEI